MFRTSIIPIRLTVVGASFAISFAAMAAPLGAVPVTQTAADEVALYAAADPATGVLAVSLRRPFCTYRTARLVDP